MNFEESIYHLIPRPVDVPEKVPLYHSQHVGKVDPKHFVLGVSKRDRGTFGAPSGKYKPDPEMFLTKHSKEPILPDRKCDYCPSISSCHFFALSLSLFCVFLSWTLTHCLFIFQLPKL